jgi:hypothetical protein
MFDRVVVVDWSANSTPKLGRDSIWIGAGDTATGVISSVNVPTRHLAMERLAAVSDEPGRTLIGVDFSLGYPHGTSAALGLNGVAWQAMWALLADMVVDSADNANNRFHVASELNRRFGDRLGPFWGCPPSKRTTWLASTKTSSHPLAEWRSVEVALRAGGYRPFSSWQLLGAGAVGSQSLLGIAALENFRRQRADRVDVWPFSSGLVVPEAPVVVCEVWPTLIGLPPSAGRVRDDVQVRTTVESLLERARTGRLVDWFTVRPADTSAVVVEEEGWVLGA